MALPAPSLDEHFAARGSKRILALDGGGMRGLISLGFLERIEGLLRERHGNDPAFRLSHYFDLIAGTSTGAIIAALLAQGHRVEDVIQLYLELADQVFRRRWWDILGGILHPRYNPRQLADFLRERLGPECAIGDPVRLRTGLLVMCKRMDSGSPWPISNNPKGRYFLPRAGGQVIANRDYPLWQVVRASTAAPTFFQPQAITIVSPHSPHQQPIQGQFIDGGVSPHNNPALQAYWLATLKGFGLEWPVGQDQLLIISVGAGRAKAGRQPGRTAARQGITALRGLMDDCAALVESLMQGLGHCLSEPRWLDSELGDLSPHELVDAPRFSYVRYDVKIHRDPQPRDKQDDDRWLRAANLCDARLKRMGQMDDATVKRELLALGRVAAAGKVDHTHFPAAFDLARNNGQDPPPQRSTSAAAAPSCGGDPGAADRPPRAEPLAPPSLAAPIRTYRQRKGTEVVAIQLNLDLEAFTYRKWGGLQTCRRGDWIVERNGSAHTVAADVFARTYKRVGPGTYVKQSVVWAAPASRAGAIATREGVTHYKQGDVLVWNDKDRQDGYAIAKDVFASLYEPVPAPASASVELTEPRPDTPSQG
ncbi:MAG: patatin-like phospholipase family protein [Cyanobacteriota bacterium]|nr:patatin-like phospholipase family protein [Cyanobacteriota bacterium]